MTAEGGRIYALGGFGGPNTDPFTDAFAYDVEQDRWTPVAPLPRARGAGAAVVLDGLIHALCDDGRLEIVEEASHWLHIEQPERVNRRIIAFLGTGR